MFSKIKLDDYDKYDYQYSYFKIQQNKLYEDNSGVSKLKGVKPNLISYDSTNNIALISADEGLYLLSQQNNTIQKSYNLFLGSLINNRKDTIAINLIFSSDLKKYDFTVPFIENKLEFKFGYNCFENPESVAFSYFLEGSDNGFSKWEKNQALNLVTCLRGITYFM